MRTRHILYTLATALALFSCVKEPVEQPTDGPYDGAATRITLSIKSDSRPSVGNRGSASHTDHASLLSGSLPLLSGIPGTKALTPQQEGLISNVHILVFDAMGDVAANEHFDNLAITDSGNISLDTPPGEGMQVFVVANGDVNDHTGATLDEKLKSIITLDELSAVLVNIDGNGLKRTDRLMMVGTATVTITKPHNTPIPVELHFLDTKATLTIKDNIPATEAITITGWDIFNIPKKSYLKERTAPLQEDAVVGITPGDYTSTGGKHPFEIVDAAAKTWTHTVYLFENRRGGRVDRSDPTNPTDKYPGMSVSDNDQRGKAWYAPAGATYMLIYGTYTKDERMNNVVYKVYLGENPINDYNLFRGKHYNYNVTISGLNNINVDTNVEWGSASFSVDKSDNLTMDAHPDFRVFRIGGTAVNITTPAYATVEVLENDGVTPCTWLAVSPLNLYRHAIKQSGSANQQFDAGNGIGTYVRTKYTRTVTPESEFSAATFGMTQKLTKIPFNQPAVYTYQNAIVYADAYESTGERTAKVKITYYRGVDGTEKAGELTYDVTQSGAIKVSDNLYIERYEESAMLIHPGLTSGLQNTATMQWGYNTETLYAADDRFTNGGYLTANAVYETVSARSEMDVPIWTATTYADYRDKYPRTGAKVTEPSSLSTTDEPYYYPELTSTTQPSEYFHPIFNSSAARYCHEKNRDMDGDGIISATEAEWYLPSFADMWYISQNMPAELNLNGNYWTATEENDTNSWGYNFPAKTEGSAAKTSAYRVRCVRGTGIASIPDATIESTETDKTKINLAGTAGASGAFFIKDNTGIPWKVTSLDASWLQIATSAVGASAAASATGTGNKTLYAYALARNSSETDVQSATLTLTRPGSTQQTTHTIAVTQQPAPYDYPAPHKGWAGCNIYWEPEYANIDGTKGRLTFDDVGVRTHENYQGVYFKWGSLVAISSMGNYNASTSILFSPTGVKNYAFASIPNADNPSNTDNIAQDYVITVHNPAINVGDICRYITERGWAPGAADGKKWRTPIGKEFRANGDYSKFGVFDVTASTNANGTQVYPMGYILRDDAVNFPASGQRNAQGHIDAAGVKTSIWSSSSGGASRGNSATGDLSQMWVNQKEQSSYGLTVRCVLN